MPIGSGYSIGALNNFRITRFDKYRNTIYFNFWDMDIGTIMEKSSAYIISQRRGREEARGSRGLKPAITISHETGAGAPEIAGQVAQILQKAGFTGREAWEVFDQQLFEVTLQGQHWPKKLAEKITEEKRFFIDELMDDLFSLRPPSWVLIPQVAETTLRLAMAGQVILVGHGATVVTAKLPNVFHVRLTGSLAGRIERTQKLRGLTAAAAAKFIRMEDRKRKKFLKTHFHARLDNELLYDLVVNTDRFSQADAAALIAEGAQKFFSSCPE